MLKGERNCSLRTGRRDKKEGEKSIKKKGWGEAHVFEYSKNRVEKRDPRQTRRIK